MRNRAEPKIVSLAVLCLALLSACDESAPPVAVFSSPSKEQPNLIEVSAAGVNEIADRYYANTLTNFPRTAYLSGVELDRHDGLEDNSLAGVQRMEVVTDGLLHDIEAIDAALLIGRPEWITHAYLLQTLRASVAQRVCRTELWNVNQMEGWQSTYATIAQLQPVGSDTLREQSLSRWGEFAGFIDEEISHLKTGLDLGYSAPKTVVQRVIDQMDGLLALEIEQSPFYSPALRDENPEFTQATYQVVAEQIYPALQRYRDYLAGDYMDQARSELSITLNPDGLACYQASLQAYTTLDRSGKEVYELGRATVAANKAAVVEMGRAAWGLDDFKAIMDRAKNDPSDRFKSKEELLKFSQDAVLRAGSEMPHWVGNMPRQGVEIVPFEEHEEGTGRSAHYQPGAVDRPGKYRIPLYQPEEQSRGNTEGVAFHEAWPGHHLQVAVGQSVEGLHPVTRIIWFSGPGEGWARYAEGLAEEMGLYTTVSGPITRRAWPARGMVVDPGIHLFGWTRQQAIDYMMEAGRFPASMGDEMVDRIAILPGQLTAYDSGGLEILSLRRQAEEALGENFDVREFHDRILENGTIPLMQLRTHIEAWIAEKNSGAEQR